MVERPFMVRLVVGSIPHGGPTQLFIVTAVVYAILSMVWCI